MSTCRVLVKVCSNEISQQVPFGPDLRYGVTMVELREFFRVVRYRAVVIALLTAIGIGTAALWLARSPDEYVATTRLFVSGASAASQYEAQQGGVYAQDRVVSYEQLVTSRALAQKTIDALDLIWTRRR